MPCAAYFVSDSHRRSRSSRRRKFPFPFPFPHFAGAQYEWKLKVNVPEFEFIEEHQCNPFAIEITSCVRVHAMQKCPAEFYSNSSECQEARRYFRRCVDNVHAVIEPKQQKMLQKLEKHYQALSKAKNT